jgi:hypothetical protein
VAEHMGHITGMAPLPALNPESVQVYPTFVGQED